MKSNKYTLFMVRFSLNDPVTPVDLLQKNDPHELYDMFHFMDSSTRNSWVGYLFR